ncbi:MAG TPA: ABC transporter ATP-binding protein [Candidatus Polarisedimenticolaceae bacterium]|nr:ABC transporter ATP-binding protein [Candidatus Polarisedimenticolaceae bacterium]
MSPVVEIKDLVKSFRGHLGIGRTVAVEGLSLTVEPGEIFGLLGPNGAGKTTTLKMMLGLLRPDRGTVRLFGRPPQDPAARRLLGFLPENPYFYDYLNPVEFLDLYGRLQGIPAADRAAKIRAALARVGLAGREKTALRKLSKGMTQRLGLAQAIQHDPDLVILDEPMSGLDPIGRREVRDLILGLRAAGKTVFFSSHILQDAEMLCDRVAIVFRGKLRSVGRLDDLVSRDAKWIEVSVRGPAPSPVAGERTDAPDGTTLFKVPDPKALTRLLHAVEGAGGEVVSVWPRRESLEDLFLREIGRAQAEERAR